MKIHIETKARKPSLLKIQPKLANIVVIEKADNFGLNTLRLIKRNPVGRAITEHSKDRLSKDQGNLA